MPPFLPQPGPPPGPLLLICAPAPVLPAGHGWRLDVKFVEGMRQHAADWPGPVHAVLWRGAESLPFGASFAPAELGFTLSVLPRGAPLPALPKAAVACVSADMVQFAPLVAALQRQQVPVVATIEYPLRTRLDILALEPGLSPLRRLRRRLWQYRHEWRLRRALARCAGVQFNGWPAEAAYRHLTARPHLYLDNRLGAGMMASPADMAARAARLQDGAPLRLIHSGRLEPMKGAQDLLAVMRALQARQVDATLDIYGTGALAGPIRDALPGFGGRVRLHDPVDFQTALVPINRTGADIFLSCHRQGDPSCSYLEAMGCGLAVAGYDNAMWAALCRVSGGGVAVRLGDPEALAAAIAAWDRDRAALNAAAARGRDHAGAHAFEAEFAGRMAHLRGFVAAPG